MTFPVPAYQGVTWGLTHHMGVIDEQALHQTLFAAVTYRDNDDPAQEINNYLIINGLLTRNVRADTGQPDAWRDYQQIVSELGLIFSTNVLRPITPTPLGLAFLDRSVTFGELITLQALRYQYPNGHRLVVDETLQRLLEDETRFAGLPSLPRIQVAAGMALRPAVLIWQVIRSLLSQGEDPRLSVDEIQRYLMRCSTNADAEHAAAAVVAARRGVVEYESMPRGRRNAQDWIKFLMLTPLFDGQPGADARIWISTFGHEHAAEVDQIASRLADPRTFWVPADLSREDRQGWYSWYGSVDLSIAPVPADAAREEPEEPAPHDDPAHGAAATTITLRPFDERNLGVREPRGGQTVHATYDAGMAARQAQLHDLMVVYVARTAVRNGALVWDDPDTVDLLIQGAGHEFIVEVKSVTPRNFVTKIRMALGQLLQYDYLRTAQVQIPRRKVIAVPARIAADSWVVPFLTEFVDMDLLSLEGDRLVAHSTSPESLSIFSVRDEDALGT